MSEDVSGIDALYDAWREAYRRGDVEAAFDLLTPDYLLWAPGVPPLGAADLRPRLETAFASHDVEVTFECEERLVSGDLAFDRGWDVQNVRPKAGGDGRTNRQRVFLVLRRQSDGRWKFARGMTQPGPTEESTA